MYRQGVTLSMIVDTFDRSKVETEDLVGSVVAVPSPVSIGMIDIYPNVGALKQKERKNHKMAIPDGYQALSFLETAVLPSLDKIRINGLARIKEIFPVQIPVVSMVLYEKIVTDEYIREHSDLNIHNVDAVLLFYNKEVMKTRGLLPDNLELLCRTTGILVQRKTQDYLMVRLPPNPILCSAYLRKVIQDKNPLYSALNIIAREESITPDNLNTYGGSVGQCVLMIDHSKIDGDINSVQILSQLCTEAKMTVLTTTMAYIIVQLPPNPLAVLEYISQSVKNEKIRTAAEVKRLNDENLRYARTLPPEQRRLQISKVISLPRSALIKVSEFIIVETNGSNLVDLLGLPTVDNTRTVCNNMHTIASVLGIESCYNYIVKGLMETIANSGSYIHIAHVLFIAEFITSRGRPYGVSFTGVSRQANGHLSLATISRAGEVLRKSAIAGKRESVSNPSASIAMGVRVEVGTGFSDVAQDIIVNGEKKTIMNDGVFTEWKRDDAVVQSIAANYQSTMADIEALEGAEDVTEFVDEGGHFATDEGDDEDDSHMIPAPANPLSLIDTLLKIGERRHYGNDVEEDSDEELEEEILEATSSSNAGGLVEPVIESTPFSNDITMAAQSVLSMTTIPEGTYAAEMQRYRSANT